MNSDEIREMLAEVNEDALVCDGLEDALVGIGESFGKSPVAVYDVGKIINIYMKRDGMTEEDAREFFEYNVLGAYCGEHMPMFVTFYKQAGEAVAHTKTDETVKMEAIPEYGELMTVAEFTKAVESNCFIDYDGHGRYATATQMTNILIWPSKFLAEGADPRWTHIVWFNK